MIFEDDFNTGSISAPWIPRPNLDGVNGIVDVAIDVGIGGGGDYAMRIGKSTSQGAFTTNAIDLPLNLSGKANVELTFWIRHSFDETQLQDGLYFSDDGGTTFQKALDFQPSDWCLGYGQFPPIQVSKLAQNMGLNATSSQFVIRFQQRGTLRFSSGSNQDGFIIDEVKVFERNVTYFPITVNSPFFETFETGSLESSWAWRFADSSAIIQTSGPLTRPSNRVAVVADFGALNSTYGLLMSKNCGDGFTTNAVDLHLDLSAVTDQLEMTFLIGDLFDETQLDDAIFLSDDGGKTFVKVFQFSPSEWCNYGFNQFPPFDLDELADRAGINFTDKFIIRFQQRGEMRASSGSNQDGIYLDNIKVYIPDLAYASVPFEETFETGSLRNMWAWRFADSTASINTGAPITRPSNIVEVQSGIGRAPSTYGVALGKNCNDGFATNALDLHLNLAGYSNVTMTFWMRNNNDETQIDDGLYFSNNGGRTFFKAKDLDLNNAPNSYTLNTENISTLAANIGNGLLLTDSFVVRFQQHGQSFLTSGSTGDGFYLDDIQVTGTSTTGILTPEVGYLRAYPNPAQDQLIIDLPNGVASEGLQLYDLAGREVAIPATQRQGQRLLLNVSSLPQGLYQVRLQTEQQPYQTRFLKQ
jgi:hypothetical protein